MKHPLQPLAVDASGVIRFKENKIVRFLLDEGPFDLNQIAERFFDPEDQEQFAQLIGYSVSGFSELSYVSDETWAEVECARKRHSDSTHDNEVTPEDVRWANDILWLVDKAEDGFLRKHTLAHVLAKERTIMRKELREELQVTT